MKQFSNRTFLKWSNSQMEHFGVATLCHISRSQEQRNVACDVLAHDGSTSKKNSPLAHQNPIQTIIQCNKIGGDSMQWIIQFKYQVIIFTSRIRKVPEQCPKCVKIDKKKMKISIQYTINFHYVCWIQFKRLLNIICSQNIQIKRLFNFFFSENSIKWCY